MDVPRITHQFWLNGQEQTKLPTLLAECRASLLRHHPDWDHRIVRDAAIFDDPALAGLRGRCLQRWDVLGTLARPLPYRADLLKLCHLWVYGGYALDLDLYFLSSLERFEDGRDLLLMEVTHYPRLVGEAVIGAPPGSPKVRLILERFLDRVPLGGTMTMNLSQIAKDRGWDSEPPTAFCPHQRSEAKDEASKYRRSDDTVAVHCWHADGRYDLKRLRQMERKGR